MNLVRYAAWGIAVTALLSCCSWAQAPQGSATNPAPAEIGRALAAARTLVNAQKNDEGIQLLKPLAAQRPEPAGVEAILGKAYYQKGNYAEAASHLERALGESPEDVESIQLLGLSDYRLGRAAQAIPLLEKFQSSLPHPDPSGLYVLGALFLDTRQFDRARAAFAGMFGVPPESAQAHLVLGQMMMHQNLEDQAAPELRQALAQDPRLPMAHFLLGEVDLYRSRVSEALAEFQAELKVNPISWVAYWRMGDAYSRLGQWDDAERALKQSIWLDQTFTGPYVLLGKVELKKGDALLAAGFLERALQMDPNNFSAHYLLGTAYQELGRTADAEREFAASQKLHPEERSPHAQREQ